jgi:hypothetical protein
VLKNPISILGLTLIVTSVAVCSAEPQAVTAGGASQARLVAACHECPRPRPEVQEQRFGPYATEHEAKQKCDSLKHHNWHGCYIKKCSYCHVWYVFGQPPNHR